MQPYFFPYLGYFQLIDSVDSFVFYDDVNYITNGWINRNRILINSQPSYITLQTQKASSNKLINEVEIGGNRRKILKTLTLSYKKAPFFESVFPLLEACLNSSETMISGVAIHSVKLVSKYLDLTTQFAASGTHYTQTKGLERADRLIEITKQNNGNHYINMLGGMGLYDKRYFLDNDIRLDFLQPSLTQYKQFNDSFVAGLSIIDVLMFNDIDAIRRMLRRYSLV